jgi:hypothetical protein
MRIPALEALSPAPWSGAARRVLPSPSPQRTATAMWGPVLAWCVIELLAESIDPDKPEQVALELFDRLRLREPFAHAFANLGFEGEESWRAAARIKVVLMTEAELAKTKSAARSEAPAMLRNDMDETEAAIPAPASPVASEEKQIGLPPDLWSDPDVRWLTRAHEAKGHSYFVREPYEELLWWLLMPSLLRLAAEPAPGRAAIDSMSRKVGDTLAEAESAGYRIDLLISPAAAGGSEASSSNTGAEIDSRAPGEEVFADKEPKPAVKAESTAEPVSDPAAKRATEPARPK